MDLEQKIIYLLLQQLRLFATSRSEMGSTARTAAGNYEIYFRRGG